MNLPAAIIQEFWYQQILKGVKYGNWRCGKIAHFFVEKHMKESLSCAEHPHLAALDRLRSLGLRGVPDDDNALSNASAWACQSFKGLIDKIAEGDMMSIDLSEMPFENCSRASMMSAGQRSSTRYFERALKAVEIGKKEMSARFDSHRAGNGPRGQHKRR